MEHHSDSDRIQAEHVTSAHDESEVSEWIAQVKLNADQHAIEKIWNCYYNDLIAYAKRKLGGLPLRDFDEEDVVADVLNSFFKGVREESFPQLEGRNDLWRILLVLTLRKVLQNIRATNAAKRGGGNVRGDSVFGIQSRPGGFDNLTSSRKGVGVENGLQLDEQLDGLGEETLKQIGLMKLEGYTNSEIAEALHLSERTIERKLEKIRAIWKNSTRS